MRRRKGSRQKGGERRELIRIAYFSRLKANCDPRRRYLRATAQFVRPAGQDGIFLEFGRELRPKYAPFASHSALQEGQIHFLLKRLATEGTCVELFVYAPWLMTRPAAPFAHPGGRGVPASLSPNEAPPPGLWMDGSLKENEASFVLNKQVNGIFTYEPRCAVQPETL